MSAEVVGTVREWDADEGIGALDSSSTPVGCWLHYSALRTTGDLRPGDAVRFTFEEVDQDGFAYRAIDVFVDGADLAPPPVVNDSSEAYRSSFVIEPD